MSPVGGNPFCKEHFHERTQFFPTPLNKRSLSDEIVFQIKEMIADGRLQPNQKLPTEQDCCSGLLRGPDDRA